MRLIDADKYRKEIMDVMACWNISPCLSPDERRKSVENLKTALNVLEEMPTVCDLDKIVQQLEVKTELAYKRYMDCNSDTPALTYSTCGVQFHERKMCLDMIKAEMRIQKNDECGKNQGIDCCEEWLESEVAETTLCSGGYDLYA